MAIWALGRLSNFGANMYARSFPDIAYRELIVLYKEHKFGIREHGYGCPTEFPLSVSV